MNWVLRILAYVVGLFMEKTPDWGLPPRKITAEDVAAKIQQDRQQFTKNRIDTEAKIKRFSHEAAEILRAINGSERTAATKDEPGRLIVSISSKRRYASKLRCILLLKPTLAKLDAQLAELEESDVMIFNHRVLTGPRETEDKTVLLQLAADVDARVARLEATGQQVEQAMVDMTWSLKIGESDDEKKLDRDIEVLVRELAKQEPTNEALTGVSAPESTPAKKNGVHNGTNGRVHPAVDKPRLVREVA